MYNLHGIPLPEPEACHRRQRLSQSLSALELTLIDFDENAASKSASNFEATLPSEKAALHGDLSSSLSPSVSTLKSVGQQSSARKSSPIRAFLTPPLMRKRKSTNKHHEDEDGSDSRLPTGNALSSTNRHKSFGFLSLLKVSHVLLYHFSMCFALTQFFVVCFSPNWLTPDCLPSISSSFPIEVVAVSNQSFNQFVLRWLEKN